MQGRCQFGISGVYREEFLLLDQETQSPWLVCLSCHMHCVYLLRILSKIGICVIIKQEPQDLNVPIKCSVMNSSKLLVTECFLINPQFELGLSIYLPRVAYAIFD